MIAAEVDDSHRTMHDLSAMNDIDADMELQHAIASQNSDDEVVQSVEQHGNMSKDHHTKSTSYDTSSDTAQSVDYDSQNSVNGEDYFDALEDPSHYQQTFHQNWNGHSIDCKATCECGDVDSRENTPLDKDNEVLNPQVATPKTPVNKKRKRDETTSNEGKKPSTPSSSNQHLEFSAYTNSPSDKELTPKLAPAKREHQKLHYKAKTLKPISQLAGKNRFWVGVLIPDIQVKNVKCEKDFIWMKGNARTTIRTVWNIFRASTALENDFKLMINGECPADTDVLAELDFYNDQHTIFRPIIQYSIDGDDE